jgi:hypothetical protein
MTEQRHARRHARGRALYRSVLDEIDPRVIRAAAEAEGLTDELVVARVLLHRQLAEHPENAELMVKLMHLLVRMVGAQHRLTGEELERFTAEMEKRLAQFIANALGEEAADG